MSFNNVTIQQIFSFLYTTYGKITSLDLELNEKKMTKAYNEDLPFGSFIKHIEDAVEYADAGRNAYTNQQILTKAYNVLLKSGLYSLGCRE